MGGPGVTSAFTVLGSGTLIPDSRRGAPSHLLQVADAGLLLDCGATVIQALDRAGVDWPSLEGVVITHFHLDHVGGLAPLLFALKYGTSAPREKPFRILGPLGTAAFLQALAGVHGPFVLEPGGPLVVTELIGGEACSVLNGAAEITTFPTDHTPESMAVRVALPGGSLGYTGDTAPTTGLGGFLAGVGLLVVECSHPDPPGETLHLTPQGVANLAGDAGPEVLVTVHSYPPLDPEAVPGLVSSAGYGGVVLAGYDGMRFEAGLGDGSWVLSDNRQ